MSAFAIQMADGSIAIMQTAVQPDGSEPTPEECLAKWHPDNLAKVVSHKPIDIGAIPTDRTFRNAWTLNGDKIEHDMAKAREIKREQLRVERAPLLVALDIAYQRADEAKNDAAKAGVTARKQSLRDVTADPAIDAAKTPEELKAIMQDGLESSPPSLRRAA